MQPSWFPTRFDLRLLLMIFATGCVHATQPAYSDPQLNNLTGNTGQTAQVEDPAMVIHIDPKTGKIIVPSEGALPGQVPQSPIGTSKKTPSELRETLSPVPGGGVMIHLDERFQTPLSATIDADDKVKFEHNQAGPRSDDKK